jgi:hypothetical protein
LTVTQTKNSLKLPTKHASSYSGRTATLNLALFTKKLPKPSVTIITGRRGSGKDVTAVCEAFTIQQATKKPVYSSYDPGRFKLPHDWRLRVSNSYESNSIQLVSDAHLEYFYAEWHTDLAAALVKLVSVSRHKDIDFVYTTQTSSLFTRRALEQVDCLILKEQSFLADKLERAEVQDFVLEANAYYSGKSQSVKWTTALAFTHEGRFEITDIQKPPWFTEEMSKIYGGAKMDGENSWWKKLL